MDNQHMAMWQGLTSTQRDRLKNWFQGLVPLLGLGYCPFNRIQSKVVTVHIGQNTLRRHLYIVGMIDSPLCRCAAGEETSAHVLCECKALASHGHTCLCSFFLDPEDVRVIWNFSKGTGLPCLGHQITRHNGVVQKVYAHHPERAQNHLL